LRKICKVTHNLQWDERNFNVIGVHTACYKFGRYVKSRAYYGTECQSSIAGKTFHSIVSSGVEICSYDSMVSCQWPNVLPGV